MAINKKILVALDDSEASMRAVRYVANVIGGKKGFTVRLFHILGPLPPELREFGGSEIPKTEQKLEKELQERRERWIERSERETLPVLEKATSILKKAGLPTNAVETQFRISTNREDLASNILDASRLNQCGTVVVGRDSYSWLREMFQRHVADELVHKGQGLTLWVVE